MRQNVAIATYQHVRSDAQEKTQRLFRHLPTQTHAGLPQAVRMRQCFHTHTHMRETTEESCLLGLLKTVFAVADCLPYRA